MAGNCCGDNVCKSVEDVICHPDVPQLLSSFLQSPFEWLCIRNAKRLFLRLTSWSICSRHFSEVCKEWNDETLRETASGDNPDGDKLMWALKHGHFAAMTVLRTVEELLYKENVYGWRDRDGKKINNISCLWERGAIKRIIEVLGVREVMPRNREVEVHETGFSLLVTLNAPRYFRQRCVQVLMSSLKYHETMECSDKVHCLLILDVLTRFEIEFLMSRNVIKKMRRAVQKHELYPDVQHAQCQLIRGVLVHGRKSVELYNNVLESLRINNVVEALSRFLQIHGSLGTIHREVWDTIIDLLLLKKNFAPRAVEVAITSSLGFFCDSNRVRRRKALNFKGVNILLSAVEALLGEASGILSITDCLMNQIMFLWTEFDMISSSRVTCWRILGLLAMHGKWAQWLRSRRVCALMLNDICVCRLFWNLSLETKVDHFCTCVRVIGSIVLYDHDELPFVLEEVIVGMDTWLDEVKVQCAACLFFKKMYWNSSYILEAQKYGACLKVLKSMEHHIDDRSLQEAAFGALFSFLRCPEAWMCVSGALHDRVRSALARHADSQYLRFYGAEIMTFLESWRLSGEDISDLLWVDVSWYVLLGKEDDLWKKLSWREHENFEKVLLSGQLEMVYDWEYLDGNTGERKKMSYRIEVNERGGRQHNLCTGRIRSLWRVVQSLSQ